MKTKTALRAKTKTAPRVNSEDDSTSSESTSPEQETTSVLPAPTFKEGIEIAGPINYVVDGDTLDVNGIGILL